MKLQVKQKLKQKRGVICLAISMLLIGYTIGFRTHNPVVSIAHYTANFVTGGKAYADGVLEARIASSYEVKIASAAAQAKQEGFAQGATDVIENPSKYIKFNEQQGCAGVGGKCENFTR